MSSFSDTQEAVVDIQNSSEENGENDEKSLSVTTDLHVEDEYLDEEEGEDSYEEDPVMRRLMECCDAGCGTL